MEPEIHRFQSTLPVKGATATYGSEQFSQTTETATNFTTIDKTLLKPHDSMLFRCEPLTWTMSASHSHAILAPDSES